MGSKNKHTNKPNSNHKKRTVQNNVSSDSQKQIWVFDSLDKDGDFAFDLSSPHFNHKNILSKIIDFSCMTWDEIKKQTHDNRNKSCHHHLPYNALTKNAKSRITALHLEEYTDSIFSMRFCNKTRIIGIRDQEKFIVKWFDPEHKFSIVKNK